jgi:hypothetical protein
MLLCKKIKIQVSEQDAAALEFMQVKCRGLYNWWVMRLRNGERWPGWEQAKKSLRESRQALAGSVLSPGQGHAGLLSPCGERRAETRLPTVQAPAPVLHPLLPRNVLGSTRKYRHSPDRRR